MTGALLSRPAPNGLACAATPTPLPQERGPLSAALLAVLTGAATATGLPTTAGATDPFGDDLQLALHLAYELHYRAAAGVDDALEWDPDVLRFRRGLEQPFLAALREQVRTGDAGDTDVDGALAPLLLEPVRGEGPSWHLASVGERWQLREYAAHRSIYHLKEADPQSFAIARLQGQAKSSYVAIQHDEYGAGRGERMHAAMFGAVLRELDLADGYAALVDAVPAVTLAPVNFMTLAGLHRTLVGAAYAQAVLIEVTSSPGSRRMSKAFQRLSAGSAGSAFYDEHVEADAVHEQVLRAGLSDYLAQDPGRAGAVVLGIRGLSWLEEQLGEHMMDSWQGGRSSLRHDV